MPVKPILVVGATGLVGSEICRQLSANHFPTRALVRPGCDLIKLQELMDYGIEIVFGDVTDPGSLHRAFFGVGTVISSLSSASSDMESDSIQRVDLEGQENVIDAALEAGADSFIYISMFPSSYTFPLQEAKKEIETLLMKTGMKYTILRPAFFMDLWLSPAMGFDPTKQKVTIYGLGANKISYIAIKDVARFAVASIINPVAWNKILDLGGPEALSQLEVVKLFEQESGDFIQLTYVPEDILQQELDNATTIEEKSLAGLKLSYARGAQVPMEKMMTAFHMDISTVADFFKLPATKESRFAIP